jgi:hypothetical protein
MIKLYNIFYNGIYDGVEPYYEDTTDNFKKWLKEHNKQRVKEGNKPEGAEEFNVELVTPSLNEENV